MVAAMDSDFRKKLIGTFQVEAGDHLKNLTAGLLELEKPLSVKEQMGVIETVFREAHSLKGAARAVNMTDIEAACQSLESVFSALKKKAISVTQELLDLLHESVNAVETLLSFPEGERSFQAKHRMSTVIGHLNNASKGAVPPSEQELRQEAAAQPSSSERSSVTDVVRISTAKLDSVLRQAEELLSAKLIARQRSAELQEIGVALGSWNKEWAKIRPLLRALDRPTGEYPKSQGQSRRRAGEAMLMEFLDWNSSLIRSLEGKLSVMTSSAEGDERSLGGMVDRLLDDMKAVLMLPFASLLEIFPKLVRDLSRDRGKEIDLTMEGTEIEIDRRILEEMKDPLIHLVRNCIDHGIEEPSVRERKKKPIRGKVIISVAQQNGKRVAISVADDGAGIDLGNVCSTAVKLGIISQQEADKLSVEDILRLIFESGVSTSPIITDVSGRGLGLAIVREKAETLGGSISVETVADIGTTFRVVLPLTLATFRGVLVRVGEHRFVLPTGNVERVMRVEKSEVKTVENRETVPVDGQPVSFAWLADVLERPRDRSTDSSRKYVQVVVVSSPHKRIAFGVDELLNEQEVLVKNLGKQLSRVRNVAGATMLPSGNVIPILNIPDLMKSAVRMGGVAVTETPVAAQEERLQRKSILVVEDSITARTLVKSILESAGYDVKTAVDGADAFTQLRTGEFDIVVSDVDMPRMNGFDLTARIRADKKLSELPVVLVTALESREDRERGIDVGANAYIVKSSFDQSNLLEVVRRLI